MEDTMNQLSLAVSLFGKSAERMAEVIKKFAEKTTISVSEDCRVLYAATSQGQINPLSSLKHYARQETNNWRKLHGFPMRRKGRLGK